MPSTTGIPDAVLVAAVVHLAASTLAAAFQLALSLGAPWGRFAMGGAFPGRYPPALRVLAVVQAVLILGLSLIVLSRAGMFNARLAADIPWLIVLPVAFAAVTVALNAASRSAGERRLWVPVGLVLLASSVVVLLGAAPATS